MQQTSFQTTYEELKHALSILLVIYLNGASRLPMRNWNRAGSKKKSLSVLLPDYLWGIETTGMMIDCSTNEWLPDYLWGIETLFQPQRRTNEVASRLPMRNWNLAGPGVGFGTVNASRLPMRNWNSNVMRSAISSMSSFQTTYEELKRYKCVCVGNASKASRLPMRNWNLSPTTNAP